MSDSPRDYFEALAQSLVYRVAEINLQFLREHPDTEPAFKKRLKEEFGNDFGLWKHEAMIAAMIPNALTPNYDQKRHHSIGVVSAAMLARQIDKYFYDMGFVCDTHELYKVINEMQRIETQHLGGLQ